MPQRVLSARGRIPSRHTKRQPRIDEILHEYFRWKSATIQRTLIYENNEENANIFKTNMYKVGDEDAVGLEPKSRKWGSRGVSSQHVRSVGVTSQMSLDEHPKTDRMWCPANHRTIQPRNIVWTSLLTDKWCLVFIPLRPMAIDTSTIGHIPIKMAIVVFSLKSLLLPETTD